MALAVYGPRGALDRRFSKDGIAFVRFGKRFQGANAVAVGRGGKIVIAGSTSNGETSRWALARLLPGGPRDRGFGGDGRVTLDLSSSAEQINDIAIVRRGAIVAAGSAEVGLTPAHRDRAHPGEREARPCLRQRRREDHRRGPGRRRRRLRNHTA